MTKKVLFVATVVKTHINVFHIPYLKMLKEMGYETHVAARNDYENPEECVIPYCDYFHDMPFERSPLKMNNIKTYKMLKNLMLKENFDIIHCHTPMGGVLTRFAYKNIKNKIESRIIYTAHGFHFYKGAPLLNWMVYYPVEKYFSKYTDTLITINKEDYNRAKNKFKKCKDIQYVPGVGIDEGKFNFELSEEEKLKIRKSLGLNKNDFVMIYPAELSKRKRQIWLIESINELLKENENIHLLLPGKDSLNGQCQNLVKELNLNDQIHILGHRTDIPKLLKISNLSLSTSTQEGLPVNIMEAMYVGLPIVATDCRGNRDLVINSKNGYLVASDDKIDFSKKISKLIFLNEISNEFSNKSRHLIENYLLSSITGIVKNIYLKKRKVIHVLASNIYSGAENVAINIIKNTNLRYDEVYCSPKGKIENTLKINNINYLPLKKFNFFEIRKAIQKFNPDIIHAHDFKASFICSLLKKDRQLIEHLHNNSPWLKEISLYSIIFLFSSIRSDSIITVSESIEKEYVFSKAIRKKIICLGNPVSCRNILSLVKNVDGSKVYDICCVARLTDQKKPFKFLKIIQEVKKKNEYVKAIWIGDGELEQDFIKKIYDLKLENNVELLGFKQNPYKYMMKSKLFLLTSEWEGYGLVAFEALTLGLPCIVGNVGGLPKIVDNSCGKLCNNVNEYVRAIEELLGNKNLYDIYTKNAEEKAKKMDNLNLYMKQIEKIYC